MHDVEAVRQVVRAVVMARSPTLSVLKIPNVLAGGVTAQMKRVMAIAKRKSGRMALGGRTNRGAEGQQGSEEGASYLAGVVGEARIDAR